MDSDKVQVIFNAKLFAADMLYWHDMLSCSLNDWLDNHFKTVRFSEFCSPWINPKSCNYHELPTMWTQNGWVLYQPCQRSHSTPWLTYMAQLLPPNRLEMVWVDGSQVAPIFHVARFSHFWPKNRQEKPNALQVDVGESLSVRKNSSFIWRLDPARTHAGKNGWSMWTTSLLNILKKCLKSAICINKNIFRFKSGKKIRENPRLAKRLDLVIPQKNPRQTTKRTLPALRAARPLR